MHLGLGIGEAFHFAIYGISFLIAFLSLCSRSEIGVLFLTSLLPIYSVYSKALKSELPLANNLTDIILVAMLIGWASQSKEADDRAIGSSPMLMPIALLILYSFMTYFMGVSLFGGITSDINIARLSHLKNYMLMPLLYLIAYYNLRERKYQYLLFILLGFTMAVADLRFRQSFAWVKHTRFMEKSRLSGTLGSLGPNEMGAFHTIYTLFLMGLFVVDRHVWRRIAYGLLIAGGMYCLVYSFSRGAYAGILAGILFIALVKARWLLVPIMVFFLTWKSIVPSAVVDRIENSIVEEGARGDTVAMGGVSIETAGRTEIWARAMDYFKENPLFGKGYNTYQFLTDWDTHNIYIKFLAEQGIIGLLLFLWLYSLAFRSGWKLYCSSDETLVKALGFGFVCAVVGSVVTNFFGDRWTYLQLGGIYWVVWALVDQYNARIAATAEGAAPVTAFPEIGHKLSNRITS
jgi:O-antigen ligase